MRRKAISNGTNANEERHPSILEEMWKLISNLRRPSRCRVADCAAITRRLGDQHQVHDGLPRGLPTADNEEGWRSSLAKLAALVEAG